MMKYISIACFLLIIQLLTACTDKPMYNVVSVEDGDTIILSINGKNERVQLKGIDAPEDTENPKLKVDLKRTGLDKEQLLTIGKQATQYLQSLIYLSKNQVSLWADLKQRDKYGRIPVVVFDKDGMPLNHKMIEEGYAIMLKNPSLEENLSNALQINQKKALLNRAGLWRSHRNTMIQWSGIKADQP